MAEIKSCEEEKEKTDMAAGSSRSSRIIQLVLAAANTSANETKTNYIEEREEPFSDFCSEFEPNSDTDSDESESLTKLQQRSIYSEAIFAGENESLLKKKIKQHEPKETKTRLMESFSIEINEKDAIIASNFHIGEAETISLRKETCEELPQKLNLIDKKKSTKGEKITLRNVRWIRVNEFGKTKYRSSLDEKEE
ncbi:hypothetical protein ILUMI_13347 [Ignelater luminosus]|uniref:Uncharacterized protein n=1 Tax=Ignelater luminosus TaxID=2038154 RepID=A0A8K0D101_IGNLU|nr:hypothetical protein ILUMI_13347 [Ignelater luminosus]